MQRMSQAAARVARAIAALEAAPDAGPPPRLEALEVALRGVLDGSVELAESARCVGGHSYASAISARRAEGGVELLEVSVGDDRVDLMTVAQRAARMLRAVRSDEARVENIQTQVHFALQDPRDEIARARLLLRRGAVGISAGFIDGEEERLKASKTRADLLIEAKTRAGKAAAGEIIARCEALLARIVGEQ